MAKIKAGIYRFNDVLSVPSVDLEQEINFSVSNGTETQELTLIAVGAGLVSGVTYVFDDNFVNVYTNEGVWISDIFKTITIPKDTDVSDEFEPWFTANTKPVLASITYNGSTIASLFGGDTATLKCKGMKMESDVVVEVTENVGGGSCENSHVIEVDELPMDNIDENSIYKVSERTLVDLVMFDGEQTISFGAYIASGQVSGSINIIPTKTTNGALVTDYNNMHAYFIEDENDIFVYGDFEGTGTNEWYLFATVLGYEGAPYNGEISSMAEATSIGYYTIFGTKAYYAKYGKNFKTMLTIDDAWIDMSTYITLIGEGLTYIDAGILPTKTTENIMESDPNGTAYGYYIEDEDNIFAYVGGEWINIPDYLSIPYMGHVSGFAEVTEEGIYALIIDWNRYISPSGIQMINENGFYDITDKSNVIVDVDVPDGYVYVNGEVSITSNGIHDVRYYERVNVSVASNYMVQSVEELPTDVLDGAYAIVLGGA